MKKDTSQQEPKSPLRRKILFGIGATGAVALIGGGVAFRTLRRSLAEFGAEDQKARVPSDHLLWCEIGTNNEITLFIPKTEMGQGIHTALAQIFADELCADWKTVTAKQAHSKHGFDPFSTMFSNGSVSVITLYEPARKAAACVREGLAAKAAQMLGVPRSELLVDNGIISVKGFEKNSAKSAEKQAKKQSLSFGEIIADKKFTLELPDKAELKPSSEFSLIGKNVKRVDFQEKIAGKAIYGYDARVPNMHYGAVARPPRYGAVLKSAEAGEAASMPGVVKVVIQDGFAGIVATTRTKARAAVKKIITKWEGGTFVQQAELIKTTTIPANAAAEGQVVQERGNAAKHLPEGSYSAEYSTPYAVHAHLEPQAGLVEIKDGKVHVHCSTQGPGLTQMAISSAIDVSTDDITVYPCYIGGGFGRRAGLDAPKEAAILAKASGKPVHVGWTREEEMKYGFYRPPTHQRLQASVDAEGKIQALRHTISSGDILFSMGELLYEKWGSRLGDTLVATFGADVGTLAGAALVYNTPNMEILYRRADLPITTGPWRGLGLLPNTFARESFMDELAKKAKIDPIEFRMKNLPDDATGKRIKAALQRAADKAEWKELREYGRAKGVALCFSAGTVVVQIAEVSVEQGTIKVHKVHAVVDAGLVVNPNGAAAQTQGAITMGLSSTLLEELTFKDGLAEASNFDSYPLLTLSQTPRIEVEFIGGGEKPFGMGEPPIGPIAAAVANAVFALNGKRLRSLPLRFEAEKS